jgi:DNA repair protein RecN (Recombination protein N)
MLSTLIIENIAVIESVEIEFSRGLNVLTGETGAGKSIILNALALLTGKRTNGSIIRHGAEKAKIEALFILPQSVKQELLESFEELADSLHEEDELLVKRVLDQSGRSKFYINGSLFPQGTVSQIARHLIEITGQHDQQHLLSPSSHRAMLDSYGVPETLIQESAHAYDTWHHYHTLLVSLRETKHEQSIRIERLRHELEELTEANLAPGEKDALLEELARLKHFDKIQHALTTFLGLFESSGLEDKGSGMSLEEVLHAASSSLAEARAHDQALESACSLFESACTQCNETKLEIESYLHSLTHDPEQYEALQVRITELNQLERKYKKDIPQLLHYLDTISKEVAEYDAGEFDEEKITATLQEKHKTLLSAQKKLTAARTDAAKKLAGAINQGLKDLQMNKAEFNVTVEAAEPSRSGADTVRFMFTANPGEPLQSLDKVASGGELSRILLLLKSTIRSSENVCLHVFDEIDAGVSGAVAQIVGEKLLSISNNSQVVIITHAAQVAALADTHFLISKTVKEGRTFSQVAPLSTDRRTEIIAGMLAGKKVSKEFLLSAKELIKSKHTSK